MKLIGSLAILVSCLLHFTLSDHNQLFCKIPEVRDYYWREYVGVIPYDAVPGGVDRMGLTTYIGQAMIHPYGELTASIYQGNTTPVASAIKTHYVNQNVKILCSNSLEKFSWIPTDIDKIQLITNCHLIVGGVDHGNQENIGRINYDEEILLGKVIRLPFEHHGLLVPNNGTETRFTHYEVLAYGCKDKHH
ncbi:hypothetical protein ILUMI_18123 [Ignelater luminosus]|uniref:Uncharacterized protein n=1 Tax=Ignelater luminosus TaxID=2038154 RepID=A0A8K0CIW5_IGNLU|nr:hypothetical protein ILUMI_18123 [Ignelater luminosus]